MLKWSSFGRDLSGILDSCHRFAMCIDIKEAVLVTHLESTHKAKYECTYEVWVSDHASFWLTERGHWSMSSCPCTFLTHIDKSEQQTPEVLKSCWQTESVDCVKFTMWIIYEIIYVQVIISCPKLCTQPNLKREIIAGLKMIHSEQRPLWTWSSHNHRHTFLSKTLSLLMWEHRLL